MSPTLTSSKASQYEWVPFLIVLSNTLLYPWEMRKVLLPLNSISSKRPYVVFSSEVGVVSGHENSEEAVRAFAVFLVRTAEREGATRGSNKGEQQGGATRVARKAESAIYKRTTLGWKLY
jgi:hypothetical protein